MNYCLFMGRFTQDPELRHTSNNVPVLNFTLAIRSRFKKSNGETDRETAFMRFEAWDSGAETIAKHFRKGDPIIVHCRAKNISWVDKEGNKHNGVVYRVNEFNFLPSNDYETANPASEEAE